MTPTLDHNPGQDSSCLHFPDFSASHVKVAEAADRRSSVCFAVADL